MVWHGDEADLSSLGAGVEFCASAVVVITARAGSEIQNEAVIRI
jgi:hypothetical protein